MGKDWLQPGSVILWKDAQWILYDIPNLDQVILKNPETSNTKIVSTQEILSVNTPNSSNIHTVNKEEWKGVLTTYNLLRPLLEKDKRARTYAEVDAVAAALGKSRTTVYRMLAKLGDNSKVSNLLREDRSDKGRGRLDDQLEELINEKINSVYLTKLKPKITDLYEEIKISCFELNIKPPSIMTVRRRVDSLDDRLKVSKRYSTQKAREAYQPIRGSFPNAEEPLAAYQIDHTPVDLILVDEEFRQPIGRANLTIVMDVCSRMIAGFCLSLDPAGALSTGLAMSQSILKKDLWLASKGIEGNWPIYGIPHKICADNAKEFRGSMLERACQEYGIIIENRPKGLPQYGGHVERMFRTFMEKTHTLSGTTFSNVQEKGDYKPDKNAALTLQEFEKWFAIFVVNVYHHKPHSGLNGISPYHFYENSILGTPTTKGVGLPPPIPNPDKLRLDFLPYVTRTIQEYGVVIDNIHYYADVLSSWIHARDQDSPSQKRKFIFARDPRDISEVYFFDPEKNEYFRVPYRNISRPPMSLWELKSVLQTEFEQQNYEVDEDMIFTGLLKMRAIEHHAINKSKKARRTTSRRKKWTDKSSKVVQPSSFAERDPAYEEIDAVNIQPFEDIDEATE